MSDLDDYLKLARAEIELQRAKRNNAESNSNPNNWILIGAGVLGLTTVIGSLIDKADLLGVNPDRKWWWERLEPKPVVAEIVKEENPGPEQRLGPHYTRTPQLRPKYSFSGTSYDHVSLEEKRRKEQFLKATPLARPKPRPLSQLERPRGKLQYSRGGGRAYSQEELKKLDAQYKA